MRRRSFLAAAGAAAAGAHLAGRPAFSQQARIKGAGDVLMRRVFEAWNEVGGAATGVRMAYDSIGSAEGLAAAVNRQVDFGAVATPLSPARLKERNLLQFPSMICPVVFAANLPGVAPGQLKLTGENLADLYLGKITKWNDPRLAEHNAGLKLPNLPVVPVHRADSSGTTLLATTYLARASDAWRTGPRAGTVVKWPSVGKAGNLNAGVAEAVKATPGAIGYVTEADEVAKGLAVAQIRNQAGKFVKPDADTFFAAVNATDWSVQGFGVDMIDLDGDDAWPILGPSFTLIPTNPTAAQAGGVRDTMKFFDWALTKGEDVLRRTGNAAMPEELVAFIHEDWATIKGPDGKPLWTA